MVPNPRLKELDMDRGTRIAIVVSIVWVILSGLGVEGASEGGPTFLDDFLLVSITPVAIYWAYRFIRAGKPRKINQPE
jgi:hypothetical protein